MSFKSHPLRGFVIPDVRLTPANEVTADAVGDELQPRAGGIAEPDDASSRLVVEATGDQDTDLVVQVEQGGHPQLGAGVRVSYRTSSEASTARRGWNAPNLITGWTAADYSTTANTMVCALGMANGQILVAYRNGSTTAYFQTYTPDSDTWSGTIAFPSTVHATGTIALAQLPEGNVVVMFRESGGQWRIYRYSVANAVSGGSWTLHAADMLDNVPGTAATWSRLLITPSGEWAFFYAYSGNLWQFASSSHGAAFTRVLAATPTASTIGDACVTASGKIIVAATMSADFTYYTIGSPWTPYTSVTGAATGGTMLQAWLCPDPNGRVYLYTQDTTPSNIVVLSFSDDDGATWTSCPWGVLSAAATADTTTYLKNGQAVFCGGSVWLCHQFVDGTATQDDSVCLMKLGGWSSITTGSANASGVNLVADDYRLAPGVDTVSYARGRTLIPIAIPGNYTGWTVTGAGTPTLTGGRVQIATTANTYYFDQSTTPASGDYAMAMFRATCTTGGSTTAHNAGLKIRLTSTSDYEVGIYLTTTSFVVYDVVGASTLATVTIDMTTDLDIFVAFIPNSHLFVAYKRPSASTWTEAYEGGATTGTASTGRYIRFGTSNSSTTTHSYRFAWCMSINSSYAGRMFAASSNGTYSDIIGRLLTAYPAAIDERSAYGNRQTYLRGKDGPGRIGDTFQARVRADYPREAIHWQVAPSPRIAYCTTADTTGPAYAWEMADGAVTSQGSTMLAMVVLNTNAPVHLLSGDPDDGGGYDTLGTMDLSTGLSGLGFARTGNVIRISGGSDATRYIWRNELVGATCELYSGGVGYYRRIARHTEGVWSGAGTGRVVELVLETGSDPGCYTGTEPASGSLTIYCKSGVLIVPNVNASTYKKLRWSVNMTGIETAEGYVRTGQVLIGAVQVVGQQWDWGWNIDHAVPTTETETRPGVVRRTAVGPMARELSFAWSEGVDITKIRNAGTTVPDYLSDNAADTLGLATYQDVPYLMAGLLAETRGGEVPIVVLPEVPTSATTITDPTMFLYGRIVSGVRLENVLGSEGDDEVYRVAQVTVREIT